MKKILGVDLGITSFGYAILQETGKDLYRCLDNSVVMRNNPYDEKSGESSQSIRSTQKSMRRLIEKRKKRIRCVAQTMERYGILDYSETMKINDPKNNPIKNRWQLRAVDAWKRPLSPQELFAIFAHMAKHRGYKSIATEDLIYELELELGLNDPEKESEKKADERRQVYNALRHLEELRKKYGGETIAQTIHRAVEAGDLRSYRNHDDYEKMIRREDIEEEIEKVLLRQAELGALGLPEEQVSELIDELKACITDQEMPTIDESLFGKCTFYKDELAAPAYSYLYDLYRLYKKLADLNIDGYEVTQEDREKVIEWVEKKIAQGKNLKKITHKDLRKILGLAPEQKIFGVEDERIVKGKKEPRTFVPFFFLADIAKFKELFASIQKHPDALQIFRELAEILQRSKTPQEALDRLRALMAGKGIDTDDRELLELFKNKRSGTRELSHRYILEALPLFLEGYDEKEVQRILGFDDREDYSRYPKSLRHLHLREGNLFEKEENPINNHAVKSLASWALGLIADLSWRYGPFDEIILETTRDALPEKIRKEIDKAMREREKALDKIIGKYKKEFPSIDKRLARKIQLWERQKGLDLYSGKVINLSQLLDGSADIEHIVPQSLGGLSTDYNTIVTLKSVNAAKGNRLPGDWLAGNPDYRERIGMLSEKGLIDWKKRKNLLAQSLDEIYTENTHSKGIRATSYLEALVAQVLKRYYPFPDPELRKNGIGVRMIPGKVTSKTRSLLGIKSKSRETNFHHAEDALILSTLTRGWQNRLHRMLRDNYGKSEAELKELWKKYMPHIEGLTLADYIDEAFRRFMSKGEESLFYRDMFDTIRSISYWVDKKPLSASSHKETVYSSRHEVPTLRKNILEAFDSLNVIKDRHKLTTEEFMKRYDKEIRQKLWLHRIGNTNDESYRAVEERATQIAQILTRYQLMDAQNDKEIDEKFQQALKELITSPIEVTGKLLRKMRFVYDKLNAMQIDRGLVETDKNMLGIHISKGPNEKLIFRRMDVNNAHELQKERSGILCYLNEMLFIFNKKGLIHYGCLRSYLEKGQGSKYIALFNPRFPANPKAQPSKFTSDSKIKQVGIGSATGIIKAHLDLDGHVRSYEVFGTLPEGSIEWFKEESGYGRVEDDPHH
ncbi:type II CRISPR RNA-guided endonuclease Cas9 [Nitratifractor salsuginis]|uniref:CRISPR-associated endonuclease Cas9 n=1 Tax=Nitratifractor salsuginis (strain DSM 16511 / JCM 12458 / E9I37-1) TaxID=749222 RepID=E6WZS9_NITSE|nr:type II CRISPR RNA-guided endonuclease Cas9 [Nitratifractor salsuginis]ADV46720.1 CRISPR-associated protein, Csn1 family [Nitratifractor salsuginis DSM 16511]